MASSSFISIIKTLGAENFTFNHNNLHYDTVIKTLIQFNEENASLINFNHLGEGKSVLMDRLFVMLQILLKYNNKPMIL